MHKELLTGCTFKSHHASGRIKRPGR